MGSFIIPAIVVILVLCILKKSSEELDKKKLSLISILIIITLCLRLAPMPALSMFVFLTGLLAIFICVKKLSLFVIALIMYFIIAIALLTPQLGRAGKNAKRIACASNLKQLGTTMLMYADDYDDHFPDKDGDAGLDMLRSLNYLSDYAVYICPSTTDTQLTAGPVKSSYIYHGGLTTSSPAETILAEDKKNNHLGYKNYLYCNGSVKGLKDPNYYDYKNSPIIDSLIKLFEQ